VDAAALVLPEFAPILLGVLLRRYAWRSPEFWVDLERLVYYVLFPVLLVRTTLTADLSAGGTGAVLLAAIGATAAGALLGAAVRWLPGISRTTAASGWQTAFRFNTVMALAVVDHRGVAALALMGVVIGVSVPVVNVLAVTALARSTAGGAAGGRGPGVLRALALNPLILATVTGLAGNAVGLTLPAPVDATLARTAAAAVPLGLLAVGAALRVGGLRRGQRVMAAYLGSVKLLAVPAVALGLCALLGVEGDQRFVVVAFAAVPSASASYVLAARMGGDGTFVATQVSAVTGAALLTLPLWLALVG
jgi:malonate transporter